MVSLKHTKQDSKNVAETTFKTGSEWFTWLIFFIASISIIQILCLGVCYNPELRGVILISFDHIFTHISRTRDQQFLARVSYLEIYEVISFNHHFHYLFAII